MNLDQDAHPYLKDLVRGFAERQGDFSVRIAGRFEAAHYLYRYMPDGSDEPMHGHSWLVEVFLARSGGGTGADGIAVDFLAPRLRLDEMLARLEHVVINELDEFKGINPTTENIARWFAAGLEGAADEAGGVVREVRVHEGPDNFVCYRPASAE